MYSKNLLHNILQLNNQKLPEYKYNKDNNKYTCTITLYIYNEKISYNSCPCLNKKESSNSAAMKAYIYINNIIFLKKQDINIKNENICSKKYINDNIKKEIVLIDIENVGYKYFNKNSRIIGFISKQSLYNKIDKIKEYMEVEVYNGKDKNGADTLMIFYIARNINSYIKNKNKIIIISNDSFSKCILNILKIYNINCELKKKI